MATFQRAFLTHGGAGSDPNDFDGPKSAANRGMDLMVKGQTALTAVVDAVTYLENDHRFNTGLGSKLRIDGRTLQLDASCMTSNYEFGAVACTGEGEFIALRLLAKEIYTWLENSMNPDVAAQRAISLFDENMDIRLIILTRNGFASNARNGMAWSHITEEK